RPFETPLAPPAAAPATLPGSEYALPERSAAHRTPYRGHGSGSGSDRRLSRNGTARRSGSSLPCRFQRSWFSQGLLDSVKVASGTGRLAGESSTLYQPDVKRSTVPTAAIP